MLKTENIYIDIVITSSLESILWQGFHLERDPHRFGNDPPCAKPWV